MTVNINSKANNHWMVKGLVVVEALVLLGIVITLIVELT